MPGLGGPCEEAQHHSSVAAFQKLPPSLAPSHPSPQGLWGAGGSGEVLHLPATMLDTWLHGMAYPGPFGMVTPQGWCDTQGLLGEDSPFFETHPCPRPSWRLG